MSVDYTKMKFPSLTEIRAERMRRRLSEFVKEAWNVIEPATVLVWNWHIEAICDHVQALMEGRLSKNNLAICVPPGSMKSTIVSVCVPAWMWLRSPAWRGLFACGSDKFAIRDSMKCRDLITSDWYIDTFRPVWYLARDQNAKGSYRNTATGFRIATTTGSKITGMRPTDLFVDDPLDAQEAHSKVAREAVKNWWAAAGNRLANMVTGHRCIIMQRLHEEDLVGIVKEQESIEWEIFTIPQEWDEKLRFVSSIGWTDPRTVDGQLMFEERFPERVLVGERARLGSSNYQGQHQQLPSAAEGELFKRGYAQFIYPASIPVDKIKQKAISWDTAVKTDQGNDWSVSLVGIEFDRGVLISERVRLKTGYPGLKEQTILQGQRVSPHALLIEDKMTGQALIQDIRSTTSLPVVPVQVSTDKVARAWPHVPYWEAGRVFFPTDERGVPEPWVEEFLTELYTFPKAVHDDQVDAFTQLLQYLVLSGTGGAGLVAWYMQQIAADKKVAVVEKKEDEQHHIVDYVKLMGAK